MILPQGNAKRARLDLSHRRLMFGLLISLCLHGVFLSLHFGLAGLGLPQLEMPWHKRSAELPPLQIVLAAPREVSNPIATEARSTDLPKPTLVRPASNGLIWVEPRTLPPPPPAPKLEEKPTSAPQLVKRAKRKQPLITQDNHSEDGFLVAAVTPEEEPAKTDNASESETGEELNSELIEAERALAEKMAQQMAQDKAAALAAAQQLAQHDALQKAEAQRTANVLRMQAEQAKAEQLLAAQEKLAKEQALRQEAQQADAKRQEEAANLAKRNAENQNLAELKRVQVERERAQQEYERELKEQQFKEQQIKEQQIKELEAKQLREQAQRLQRDQQAADELRRQAQELADQASKRAADQAKAAEQARLAEQAKAQADAKTRAETAMNTPVAQTTNSNAAGNSNSANQGDASGGKSVPFVLPKNISGSSLLDNAKSQLKNLDLSRPPRPAEKEANSARRSVFGSTLQDVPVRMYVEAWQQKIERNGRMNYSQLSSNKARGDPLVNVIIRSDGSVEEVLIMRSSGRADIDDAVRRIVHLNAPYAVFPKNIAAKYDQIEIRRVWGFDEGLKLLEELR